LPETNFGWAFSNCRSIPAIQVAGRMAGSDGLPLPQRSDGLGVSEAASATCDGRLTPRDGSP
jgi:hypothetical protein